MAEEFLTKKMIDENQLFKPKLNWGTIPRSWDFNEMYYSVEDVKRNYLVRTSLDNNQLVVETDDIQAEDTTEWNLTIRGPVLAGDKKAKSVRISGNLGTIYYSFSKDDINTSSIIDFGSITQSGWWYELKDNKYEFDPIFVVDTSGETSGMVTIDDGRSLTLEFKCTDDSILKYTSKDIHISILDNNITIFANKVIIDPPIGGGGDDDDESIYADIYLRYAFSSLKGEYYQPQFSPVWYNTTGDNTSMSNRVEITGIIPNTISSTSDSIDILLGKNMNTRQSLYLWNNDGNSCGRAAKSLSSSLPGNIVMLHNGLSYSAIPIYPLYDSTKQRYVIRLNITASRGVDTPIT